MISIIDDVIDCVKSADFSIDDVTVREAYLNGVSLNPPLITVDEQLGNTEIYIDSVPNVVRNQYTIEYYVSQAIRRDSIPMETEENQLLRTELNQILHTEQVNAVPLIPTQVGRALLIQVDNALQLFGLTMIGNARPAPYENPNIIRIVTNYYCYIDTKTKQIYRRIST